MRKLIFGLMALALSGLFACTTVPKAPPVAVARQTPAPLIYISIDAFRADYLERGLTPNLKALAEGGALGTMRPSFPSLTFPNHYTLVTGLTPDHHGMVANYMYDPTHPADPNDPMAAYFTKTKSGDGFWWQEGKPLWVNAEQAGLKTGIVFWPGSQAEIDHTRPTFWLPFEKAATSDDRVTKLLQWMDLPADQRPAVYLLYLDAVDELGHKKGPDSADLNAGLTEVDTAIGRLIAEVKKRGLNPNIVLVSDHGMIDVSPSRTYFISELLGKADLPAGARTDPRYDLIYYGSLAMLNPAPGYEAQLEKVLIKTRYDHMQCWHKSDIPARFKYGKNHRVTKIVCLGEPGWQVSGLSIGTDVGNHGYDPVIEKMRAIFIANGPDVKAGVTLKTFDNVSVYGFVMTLLRLKPLPNDGKASDTRAALKP